MTPQNMQEARTSCMEIEIALIEHFNPRQNLIVPNISWGMFLHECDLFVLSKAGVATEIEIKTDKYDLIKDKLKRHGHNSQKIQWLYFAIPTILMPYIEHIPEKAGIIEIRKKDGFVSCHYHREPKRNGEYKFTEKERFKIARLGTMRIGGLKKTIDRLCKDLEQKRLVLSSAEARGRLAGLEEGAKVAENLNVTIQLDCPCGLSTPYTPSNRIAKAIRQRSSK